MRTANLYGQKPATEFDAEKVGPYNTLCDLFDGALGGLAEITTTGGTTTLTTEQATKARIKLTGTLASNATIEIPISAATGRVRNPVIHNSTTGDFTLKVKLVGGSTLIEIKRGQAVIISHDGTNTTVVQTALTSWTAATLLNSWANYNAGTYNSASYRIRNGRVELQGVIAGGTLGQTAFTLPVGFRPAKDELLATVSNNGFGALTIYANGNVTPGGGSNVWFSLDGISFDPA